MYDPRPNSPVLTNTAPPIPGNKIVDKPAYILTSSGTQSAAEYFVYNLKMLKPAMVDGETTAGHEHSGGSYRINDHFGMGIQDAATPRNPYTMKGWKFMPNDSNFLPWFPTNNRIRVWWSTGGQELPEAR